MNRQQALALYAPMRKRAGGAWDSVWQFIEKHPKEFGAAGGGLLGTLLGRMVSGNWRGGLVGGALGGIGGYTGGGWWQDRMANKQLSKNLFNTTGQLAISNANNMLAGAENKKLQRALAAARSSAATAAEAAKAREAELQGQLDAANAGRNTSSLISRGKDKALYAARKQLDAANAREADLQRKNDALAFEKLLANNSMPPLIGPTNEAARRRALAMAEAAKAKASEAVARQHRAEGLAGLDPALVDRILGTDAKTLGWQLAQDPNKQGERLTDEEKAKGEAAIRARQAQLMQDEDTREKAQQTIDAAQEQKIQAEEAKRKAEEAARQAAEAQRKLDELNNVPWYQRALRRFSE